MAYDFTSGSSQYLVGSNTSAYNFVDATVTFSFWIKTTTTGNQGVLAKGANSASDRGWHISIGNVTAGCILCGFKRGTGDNFTAAQRESIATVNDGAEHHVAITAVTSSSNQGDIDINIYIDSTLSQGAQTTNSAIADGNSTSNLSIGCRGVPTSPSNFLTGTVAEVAMWNVILTQGEITSLAVGASPISVRPASRVAYFPLVRDLIEVMQALGLTNTNSAAVAAHPRIYGP